MIVRTWHGCVPVEFGDAFAVHLQATGVQHSQGISGNAGAFVRRETQGEWEHFSWQRTGTIWMRSSPLPVKRIMSQ
jgi:hypothetical protein